MNNQRTFVMLEPPEDSYFEKLCSEREKNFNWNNGLSHDEVWAI